MSVPQESISDILTKSEPAEVAAAPESTGETVDKTDAAPPAAGKTEKGEDKPDGKQQVRDENGKFAKTEEAKAPVVEDTNAAKPRADVAAIIDERRKRQAAEARVRELEGKGAPAKPSVFENEDEAISSRVNEATRPLREMLYQQSMRAAKAAHGNEYDTAAEAFADAAQHDESLIEGLRRASDPGEYVFMHGMYQAKLAPHGGDVMKMLNHETGTLKSQVTERDTRIKALEAENAKLKQEKADLETLPRSLNSRASAAPAAGSEDDEDIGSIVRFGTKSR